jgi:hypothetical protein
MMSYFLLSLVKKRWRWLLLCLTSLVKPQDLLPIWIRVVLFPYDVVRRSWVSLCLFRVAHLQQEVKKSDLMPWIEKIGNKLPGCKAALMNMAGRSRTTWARFVISTIPIYVLIAIKVPKWFIKAIDKIRRAFVWKGRQQVNGGTCLVAWDKVQRPLDLGGQGILNLENLSWALQIRWLWLQKIGDARVWKGLQILVLANAFALFSVAVKQWSEMEPMHCSGLTNGSWVSVWLRWDLRSCKLFHWKLRKCTSFLKL